MSGRGGTTALRGALSRMRGRPDSEHEMAFNRVVFGCVGCLLIYLLTPGYSGLLIQLGYVAIGLAVLVGLAFDPAERPLRRVAMMVADVAAMSIWMHLNGVSGAAVFPLYLWIIFGNGFRFGIPYLHSATAISMVAFAAVVLTTPFWRDAPALAIGFMVGLLVLPTYAGALIRKMSRAKLDAEEANRAKSYFLASVSHELRTPLTAIIGLGEHLRESNLAAAERDTAGTIVTAGRSLLSLINQLLDFSRTQAKGLQASDLKPFDLLELMLSVRALLQHQAEQKGLRLVLHIPADVPTRVIGDERHLRDILTNLAGNAVKFTEHGSVIIAATEGSDHRGPRLLFEVLDTGIGIAEDAQERIFGSFVQADDSIIDRFGGTGLGLAICRQLVDMLGGSIGVESRLDIGSRFWFDTPVALAEAVEATAPLPRRGAVLTEDPALVAHLQAALPDMMIAAVDSGRRLAEAAGDRPIALFADARTLDSHRITGSALALGLGRPAILIGAPDRSFVTALDRNAAPAAVERAVRIACAVGWPGAEREDAPLAPPSRRSLDILIADDNPINRKVFGMMLDRAGHRVTEATEGESALDLMRDHSFDIVLMDVNMPRLNGIDATRLYRFAALGQARVPIVGVTADASEETRQRCLDAGMDDCIAKPVDSAALLALIDELATPELPAAQPIHDPTGVVTSLFAPNPPAELIPVLDRGAIAELMALGGEAFVADLIAIYLEEATAMLIEAQQAVASGDVQAFRDSAHALRSSAANIGAMRLADMCIAFQRIDPVAFATRGGQHVDRLSVALADVAAALTSSAIEPAGFGQPTARSGA